jgi:hypothetical protein
MVGGGGSGGAGAPVDVHVGGYLGATGGKGKKRKKATEKGPMLFTLPPTCTANPRSHAEMLGQLATVLASIVGCTVVTTVGVAGALDTLSIMATEKGWVGRRRKVLACTLDSADHPGFCQSPWIPSARRGRRAVVARSSAVHAFP